MTAIITPGKKKITVLRYLVTKFCVILESSIMVSPVWDNYPFVLSRLLCQFPYFDWLSAVSIISSSLSKPFCTYACIRLDSIELCNVVLCFILSYCIYSIEMYCTILYCITLYCVCIVLYCIVLFSILSYRIVLRCIVPYCIVPYCIVWYCIVE